jgi:hypothetical protein
MEGLMFHFDAEDPSTYELDEKGRVIACGKKPDGTMALRAKDNVVHQRPVLVKLGSEKRTNYLDCPPQIP